VLIYYRSNWEWYCKQVLQAGKPCQQVRSVEWAKKQQLVITYNDGQMCFSEFSLVYTTTLNNFNHKGTSKNGAYVAFVNGVNVNLTKLSDQIIPPPLFNKQIKLPAFPTCLSLYNNTGCAFSQSTREVYMFDVHQEVQESNFPYHK
jgi:hypothetical protein